MKSYKISCCRECPALVKRGAKTICKSLNREFENTDATVDATLIGFPSWCPLADCSIPKDYRRDVRKMIQILDAGDYEEGAVAEAANYIGSVVERAKAN